MRYGIGELARRTGLSVKAIRFYADRGIVPATGRDAAGNRRYDEAAAARLDLVRTLRDLGVDLPTVRGVVRGELTVAEVAATHAEVLAARVGELSARRAVLTAVAERGAPPAETLALATLSPAERGALVDEFLAEVFGAEPEFAGMARTLTPELPAEPDAELVGAWLELAALARDPEFRASMRRMAAGRGAGLRRDVVAVVRDVVGPASAAGVAPGSAAGRAVVAEVVARCGPVDLAWLAVVNDPRRDRYLRLLAVVNGWRAPTDVTPAVTWFLAAAAAAAGGASSADDGT